MPVCVSSSLAVCVRVDVTTGEPKWLLSASYLEYGPRPAVAEGETVTTATKGTKGIEIRGGRQMCIHVCVC